MNKVICGLAAIAAVGSATPVSAAQIFTSARTAPVCCAQNPTVYAAGSQQTPAQGSSSTVEAHLDTQYVGGGAPITADAMARASLTTGQLGVYAESASFAEAGASARLLETLNFTVGGATANQVTPIQLDLFWHGEHATYPSPNSGSSSGQYIFGFTRNGIGGSAAIYSSSSNGGATQYAANSSGWLSSNLEGAGTERQHFTLLYGLIGPTSTVDLSILMTATTFLNGEADLFNTATISFTLPQNVTYTSSSGVFLTDTAVPEPSTWAMMLLGFFGLGKVLRARRRASTAAAILCPTMGSALSL